MKLKEAKAKFPDAIREVENIKEGEIYTKIYSDIEDKITFKVLFKAYRCVMGEFSMIFVYMNEFGRCTYMFAADCGVESMGQDNYNNSNYLIKA